MVDAIDIIYYETGKIDALLIFDRKDTEIAQRRVCGRPDSPRTSGTEYVRRQSGLLLY
jgi:hypothetical protein